MNSDKAKSFNGVDTQTLSRVFSSMQNQPEMAKVAFSVKSEWNGGFSVGTTASKDFILVAKIYKEVLITRHNTTFQLNFQEKSVALLYVRVVWVPWRHV